MEEAVDVGCLHSALLQAAVLLDVAMEALRCWDVLVDCWWTSQGCRLSSGEVNSGDGQRRFQLGSPTGLGLWGQCGGRGRLLGLW